MGNWNPKTNIVDKRNVPGAGTQCRNCNSRGRIEPCEASPRYHRCRNGSHVVATPYRLHPPGVATTRLVVISFLFRGFALLHPRLIYCRHSVPYDPMGWLWLQTASTFSPRLKRKPKGRLVLYGCTSSTMHFEKCCSRQPGAIAESGRGRPPGHARLGKPDLLYGFSTVMRMNWRFWLSLAMGVLEVAVTRS